MIEDICPIVPANPTNPMNWQKIMIIVGLTMLSLLFCYFFYKFVNHTNQRFKLVETAINQMNDRIREKQSMPVPPPAAFPHLFMAQASMPQPQPQTMPLPPPRVSQVKPVEVVVDSKVLDKELSEELKELDVSVEEPEGRVDADQDKNEPTDSE